ncbi:MAG: hypothetical protein M3T56_06155 [Chloroflexota bacterium]|nr:hypothetical protein [Chloroflexota bacterium]
MTRGGTYTQHERILYRCWPRPPAKSHAFTIAPAGVRRRYRYPTAEIAHALWLLGRGTSFWQAGADARQRTGRPDSEDTNLAATWLERFSEPIFEELRPRPKKLYSVVIDSVPFNVAALDYKGDPVPGGEMRFVVFGAATQKHVGGPYQVLLLRASWHKDASSWRSFLRDIEGEADRIVCDGEQALLQSAKARWPRATVALSVFQVRQRAEEILTKHKLQSRTKPLWPALRQSMRSASAWRRSARLARQHKLPDLERWIIDTEAVLGPQFARHERFTSTGAIESVLRGVKKQLTLQRGSYKRVERLSMLLNLHTLARNRLDREADYARIITAV